MKLFFPEPSKVPISSGFLNGVFIPGGSGFIAASRIHELHCRGAGPDLCIHLKFLLKGWVGEGAELGLSALNLIKLRCCGSQPYATPYIICETLPLKA